jgi:hypothetical protein
MVRRSIAIMACVLAAVAGLLSILVPMLVVSSPLWYLLATVVIASIVSGLALLTAYLFYDNLPVDWYVPGVGVVASCLLILLPLVFEFTSLASVRLALLYSNVGCGLLGLLLLVYAMYAGRDAGSLSTFDSEERIT